MTDTISLLDDYTNYLQDSLHGDAISKSSDMNKFLEFMLKKTSLIPINFDEAEVCTMKKDAKAILSNMIGNIGGTLGVFIKFSFIGVLTSMIDFFLYLHGHVRNLLSFK